MYLLVWYCIRNVNKVCNTKSICWRTLRLVASTISNVTAVITRLDAYNGICHIFSLNRSPLATAKCYTQLHPRYSTRTQPQYCLIALSTARITTKVLTAWFVGERNLVPEHSPIEPDDLSYSKQPRSDILVNLIFNISSITVIIVGISCPSQGDPHLSVNRRLALGALVIRKLLSKVVTSHYLNLE